MDEAGFGMISSRRCFVRWVAALVIGVAVLAPRCGSAAQERLVAIGDIHGDFDAFVAILQQAGLIGAEQRWTGGTATLVQTGDFVDRGPRSRMVMDLLMSLEKEASKAGGRVVVLLGNHELMNLIGDLRYVSNAEYASYADEKSEKRRQNSYRSYVELRRRSEQAAGQARPVATAAMEKQWMDAHPPGFIEHREAFGPEGKYGRWLRTKAVVFQEGGAVFLHGGISPRVASMDLNHINERVKKEIRVFDVYLKSLVEHGVALPIFTISELTAAASAALQVSRLAGEDQERRLVNMLEGVADMGGWLTINQDGPLWFRGFAEWTDDEGAKQVAGIADAYRALHFVVGHTVQPDGRIHERFGGKVFLIDTGMLSSYFPGGRASALEIVGGGFTAIYPDKREALFGKATAGSRGQ